MPQSDVDLSCWTLQFSFFGFNWAVVTDAPLYQAVFSRFIELDEGFLAFMSHHGKVLFIVTLVVKQGDHL